MEPNISWDRNESFSDREVKLLAETGLIWRERYFWNNKLQKTGNCGMYQCFCVICGLNTVHINRWTPEFNICIPCHIKAVRG